MSIICREEGRGEGEEVRKLSQVRRVRVVLYDRSAYSG